MLAEVPSLTLSQTSDGVGTKSIAASLLSGSLTINTNGNKIRPIRKTKDEIEKEKQLYFTIPRKTSEQIIPYILKIKHKTNRSEQSHHFHLFKKMLKRNRIKKLNEIMQHLIEFDKSEAIIPHGEVSKKIYQQIANQRDFDLYGKQMSKLNVDGRTQDEMKLIASMIGIEYTQTNENIDAIDTVNIFSDRSKDLKPPAIATSKWNVGIEQKFNAPVGFAANPVEPARSQGNEQYFSYDGEWQNGMMNGYGMYLYEDKHTYVGKFKDNKADGDGEAIYKNGNIYGGEWSKGRYEGKGTSRLYGGSTHTGEYILGRKFGHGKLELACGLTYEGDFVDGLPHGKGVMKSLATQWTYDGQFSKGSILGTGTLVTPKGERIVRYWEKEHHNDVILLPKAVQIYLEEKRMIFDGEKRRSDIMFGEVRGKQLKRYVEAVRRNIFEESNREKREIREASLARIREQKQKLNEARLKALTDVIDATEALENAAAAASSAKK